MDGTGSGYVQWEVFVIIGAEVLGVAKRYLV